MRNNTFPTISRSEKTLVNSDRNRSVNQDLPISNNGVDVLKDDHFSANKYQDHMR